MSGSRLLGWMAVSVAVVLMAGCEIQKRGEGENKDVKIETPFGGMRVKTNDAVSIEDIGLPAYPGATPVKNDKDSSSADVSMNFGSFHLGVRAAGFHTTDSPARVEAFYRDGLKYYGDVIACRDDQAVGEPERTADGLTCDDKGSKANVNLSSDRKNGAKKKDKDEYELKLKAGSKGHQHIVAISADGSGTKFGLVALDLPMHMGTSSDDDRRQ